MKKIVIILSLLYAMPCIVAGCTNPTTTPVQVSMDKAYSGGISPTPSPTSDNSIGILNPGILPDTSLSLDEQKLAGLLARKVKVEFPVKLGILLYRETTLLEDKTRKAYYNNFVEKLKANSNISQVVEIPASLVGKDSNIEDLRKLAARFQVAELLIINDKYQPTYENKDAVITPIDIVTGIKNWESYSNIEVFALDILNGVFVYSGSVGTKSNDKYNKDNPKTNKDDFLTKDSALKAWNDLTDKVVKQLEEFKKQVSEVPASPVPSPSPTNS